jgi:hypothetical protein
MKNSFELRNSYELRRRLETALSTAERRLSEEDFAHYAPQLKLRIQELDQSIEGYERFLVGSAVSSVCGMFFFRSYNVSGVTLIPQAPSVRIGSSPSDSPIWGLSFRIRPQATDHICGPLFR